MRKALGAVAVVSALAATTATMVATDNPIERAANQFLVELSARVSVRLAVQFSD